jgi:hypothetical protein
METNQYYQLLDKFSLSLLMKCLQFQVLKHANVRSPSTPPISVRKKIFSITKVLWFRCLNSITMSKLKEKLNLSRN